MGQNTFFLLGRKYSLPNAHVDVPKFLPIDAPRDVPKTKLRKNHLPTEKIYIQVRSSTVQMGTKRRPKDPKTLYRQALPPSSLVQNDKN